jgi:hypothetical protein
MTNFFFNQTLKLLRGFEIEAIMLVSSQVDQGSLGQWGNSQSSINVAVLLKKRVMM